MSSVLIISRDNLDLCEIKDLLIRSGYNVYSASDNSFLSGEYDVKPNEVVLISGNLIQEASCNDSSSETHIETIFSLAKLAQTKDDYTGEHINRVQKFCRLIAEELLKCSPYSSQIDNEFIDNFVNASALYDIGKVGISDSILLKNARLTEDEFEIMKMHTIMGFKTLEDVSNKFGSSPFIEMGKAIARSHHERWDGKGYPDALKGEHIPLPARIMSVVDVYEALSSKRAYKDAYSVDECIKIIKEGKGTQFDPVVVDAFLNVYSEL